MELSVYSTVREVWSLKTILFFVTSLAGGGAEKVLVNLANHLDKNKYCVTVMTLFDVGINKQFLNADVEYKYVLKKIIRGNSHLFKLFSAVFLYKWMIKEDYDIIVSFFQGVTTRIIAGCSSENTKLVQWIHNEFHSKDKIAVCYRNVDECVRLQKKYDATVYVAKTVKEIYLRSFPEIKKKDVVLYNVIETEKIRKMAGEPVEEVLYDADITLVSVGRLVPQKCFDRLLSILSRLNREAKYDVKLLLLGSGKLEKKLKLQAEQLKIQDQVVFLGYKENPYKYIKRADLFVCSSLHEGFSTAVTESLVIGTPIITTLCSGMEELLGDNKYGVIVDNNEEALYQGILSLLENTQLLEYYQKMALERGKQFDCFETVSAVEAFFDTL